MACWKKQGSWVENRRKNDVEEVSRDQLDLLGLRDHVKDFDL